VEYTPEAKARFDAIVARYPRRQAALLPVLHLTQRELGHLSTEAQLLVARTLDVPPTLVREVVTFYEMFHEEPEGQFHLEVCTNISCHLLGGDALLEHFKKKLAIECGHHTEDGLFSLMESECLASCGSGPMMRVGLDYYEHLTPEAGDFLITKFRLIAPKLQGKHYEHAEGEPHVGAVPGFEPPKPRAQEASPVKSEAEAGASSSPEGS